MMKKTAQNGFTLIELMISIAIYTGVLLLATVATAQIGRMYYKSLIQANAQQATKQISDLIGQQIRLFNTSPIAYKFDGINLSSMTANDYALNESGQRYLLCLGYARYYITIDRQLRSSPTTSNQASGVFVQRQAKSALCELPNTPDLSKLWSDPNFEGGSESIPYNGRLSYMRLNRVNSTSKIWNLDLVVIIGDQDTIERPGGLLLNSQCVGKIFDSQFCATSKLNTAILKRIGD